MLSFGLHTHPRADADAPATVSHRHRRVITLTQNSDANVTPSDASVTPGDANGDAKEGPKSQARRGFAPFVTPSDAKNPHLSVATTGKREKERAGEGEEREKKECGKSASLGVTGVTTDAAASPGDAAKQQNTEPADHQAPVDDEEIGTCACGRPADRYTATGQPICSACGEAASARQEEAPTAAGKAGPGAAAKPQNTESPGDDDAAACFCGKPADRVTATGKPICSECAELDDYFITPDTDLEEWWRRYGNAEDKGDE